MSRINEALRRAVDDQGSPEAEVAVAVPIADENDTSALVSELFPVESAADRRKHHPPTDAASSIQPRTTPGEEPKAAQQPQNTLSDRIESRVAEKFVAHRQMSAVSREQYRRLAGVLLDAQGTNGVSVVMVASAAPGEGKTLTALNIAMTLSESYRRKVLLIDADLRKPSIDKIFHIDAASGLVEGLEAQSTRKLVVRHVSANLAVLPAGRPTSDPMAALTSDRMRQLVEEARRSFDWVIIDTPPLMLLPDAHLLSSLVDGAVLVVKAASTSHEMVKRTADAIGRARILGVVLNQADAREQPTYNGYQGGNYATTEISRA